jgi:hypothetical protein
VFCACVQECVVLRVAVTWRADCADTDGQQDAALGIYFQAQYRHGVSIGTLTS